MQNLKSDNFNCDRVSWAYLILHDGEISDPESLNKIPQDEL